MHAICSFGRLCIFEVGETMIASKLKFLFKIRYGCTCLACILIRLISEKSIEVKDQHDSYRSIHDQHELSLYKKRNNTCTDDK